MKKLLSAVMMVALCCTVAFGQAKKPTIMVVPSDNWCQTNNYMLTYDNMGKSVSVPDYEKALQSDADLQMAIAKIEEMMAERGFPLKNLEAALKGLKNQSAEDAMLTSKDGAEVSESPIDKLKKTAKADIIIQLGYTVAKTGPKSQVNFILKGLDSYTDKAIANASGTGPASMGTALAIQLQEAVLSYLDQFNSQLMTHFEDMAANGREISLRIKVWDDFEDGLEREFDGDELGEIIEKWVSDNTVQGRFNTTDMTENMALFEQVRIPLYNEKGKAVDARGWAQDLRKYLRANFEIESKVMTQGLGQAQLVIGGK